MMMKDEQAGTIHSRNLAQNCPGVLGMFLRQWLGIVPSVRGNLSGHLIYEQGD